MLLSLAGNDLCRIAVAPRMGSVNLNNHQAGAYLMILVAPHTGSVNLNHTSEDSKESQVVAPHTGSVNLNTMQDLMAPQSTVAPHTGSVNINCPHNADEKITKRRSPYGERESKCRRAI